MISRPVDCFKTLIIAHDVGRSRDRSTAVIGGLPAFNPNLIAIRDAHELSQGLYGSARASELATIDRHYESEGLIIADLSNDPTYAEVLYETFGRRAVGLQISRHGDGMDAERRPVKNSVSWFTPLAALICSNFIIRCCSLVR
jgi:hypothetical protein